MVRQSSRADETRWWSDGVDVRSGKKEVMVVGDMCDGCEHEIQQRLHRGGSTALKLVCAVILQYRHGCEMSGMNALDC